MKGVKCIPEAFKLFDARPLALLAYGSQMGFYPNNEQLEILQTKFTRAPICVSNAT